mmetsp:Transcript_15235/g.26618  ORF Transcript_15235/g.26618 Transcript_15235/m.26618 type:complete len:219 (-) Transcript_15235:32-688(-)
MGVFDAASPILAPPPNIDEDPMVVPVGNTVIPGTDVEVPGLTETAPIFPRLRLGWRGFTSPESPPAGDRFLPLPLPRDAGVDCGVVISIAAAGKPGCCCGCWICHTGGLFSCDEAATDRFATFMLFGSGTVGAFCEFLSSRFVDTPIDRVVGAGVPFIVRCESRLCCEGSIGMTKPCGGTATELGIFAFFPGARGFAVLPEGPAPVLLPVAAPAGRNL